MKLIAFASIALLVSLGPLLARASESGAADLCEWPRLGAQPVLVEGRAMPLEAYASDLSKRAWVGQGCESVSFSRQYCYLSLGKRADLRSRFGCVIEPRLTDSKGRQLTIEEAEQVVDLKLQALRVMERDPEMKGNGEAISKLKSFIGIVMKFRQIERGQDWKVLSGDSQWAPLANLLLERGEQETIGLVKSGASRLSGSESHRLAIETWLHHLNFPLWTLGFCLLGIVGGTVFRMKAAIVLMRVTLIASVLTLGLGLAARIAVSQRAPVTNMFETVVWFGLVSLIGAFVLGVRTRENLYLRLGFAGCAMAMVVALADNQLLDSSIKPLVPALRSDFWLSTHVLSVTGSYALFGVSWLVSNYALWLHARGKASETRTRSLTEANRHMIQWGALFLSLGIFLGALWADRSWGRFWGWDPKETWSLITLIVYMALLHGKAAGWFKPLFFNYLSVVSFLLVVMTWFGVNWIFAKGLHSYGFSSGGAAGVVGFCVVQLTLLLGFALKQESSAQVGQ